jgi:mRNA-decapping enzyme subunit 2
MPVVDDEDDGGDENIFRDMTFDEVLEDLNARFLVNLPKEEMTLVRIYWQAEQA